ncbi:MAG: RNA methyltransferase [Alphaproteobacteria bacterium]|nr:RNA methyltransferase [Alphaproteobacteria bacterium]
MPMNESYYSPDKQRGFFGIGVEYLSKPHNAGSLYRTAHAFHADFVFAINATNDVKKIGKIDTSQTHRHVPFYFCDSLKELPMPFQCELVGVELLDDADFLPDFKHPERAIYILGPEKGELQPETITKCQHLIKIPTKFCVNVGIAGALILYDRYIKQANRAQLTRNRLP